MGEDAKKKFWEARQKALAGKGGGAPRASGGGSAGGRGAKSGSKPVAVVSKATHEAVGTVLIVEPEKRLQLMLRNEMKICGFEPVLASNAAEAIEAAKEQVPLMIILEKELPDMAGFTCCSRLRALPGAEEIPILLTSTDTDPAMKDQAIMVGASAYVPKPLNLGKLQALGKAVAEKARKRMAPPPEEETPEDGADSDATAADAPEAEA